MNKSDFANQQTKQGKWEAIKKLTLEKPNDPGSRRDVQPGQAFDATDEELESYNEGVDFKVLLANPPAKQP